MTDPMRVSDGRNDLEFGCHLHQPGGIDVKAHLPLYLANRNFRRRPRDTPIIDFRSRSPFLLRRRIIFDLPFSGDRKFGNAVS